MVEWLREETRVQEVASSYQSLKLLIVNSQIFAIIWHTFWLALANSMYFWVQCCKWPIIKQIIQQSGRTVDNSPHNYFYSGM